MFVRRTTIATKRISVCIIRGYVQHDRECIPRSEAFYEEENIKRNYYYVMDLRGQLFVENIVRNIATSMKDVKFLDFMFKNLQMNNSGFNSNIPFVTYCGKEKNFVTPIDCNSAFVFKDIVAPKMPGLPYQLLYGGTLTEEFDPSRIAFSRETGRMYHEIRGHKHLSNPGQMMFGLFNVNITSQHFADRLIFESEHEMYLQWESATSSGSKTGGLKNYPIQMLQ